jgi:uncharacterized protein YceK
MSYLKGLTILVFILTLILLAGCASIRGYHANPEDTSSAIVYGSPMGSRSLLVADDTRAWMAMECVDISTAIAWCNLYQGTSSPGEALYYYKCKGPNEYKEAIARIKWRWMYQGKDIEHHPEGRRK